ncbi:hypothetical protein [Sphingomonas japonica]|uniref:Membrane protein n=1 Tax=Sphingomonas japonica TaxID=511662 RepID=A0ABX0U894_9SPHN|nr:hypothetical protein [Sphingomonas japonica]NIJ24993.1 putative membrane protein [Sphingomonas japonica]
MSRSIVILIVVLVAIVGGMFLLSQQATEQPAVPVEKAVALENLSS